MEILEPDSGCWRTATGLQAGRCNHASVVHNGQILVIGGEDRDSVSGLIEAFDPETQQWNAPSLLKIPRLQPTCIPVGGKLYVIGGCDDHGRYVCTVS